MSADFHNAKARIIARAEAAEASLERARRFCEMVLAWPSDSERDQAVKEACRQILSLLDTEQEPLTEDGLKERINAAARASNLSEPFPDEGERGADPSEACRQPPRPNHSAASGPSLAPESGEGEARLDDDWKYVPERAQMGCIGPCQHKANAEELWEALDTLREKLGGEVHTAQAQAVWTKAVARLWEPLEKLRPLYSPENPDLSPQPDSDQEEPCENCQGKGAVMMEVACPDCSDQEGEAR